MHLGCGVFGTICVGLFAKEGVTTLSGVNGLFYGGGFKQLGTQLIGIVAVGAFVFLTSCIVWYVLKATIGIRVSREEELAGLDIGEHGNMAYPDFAPAAVADSEAFQPEEMPAKYTEAKEPVWVPVERAVPAEQGAVSGKKMTKVTIVANQTKFAQLQDALEKIGITGMTVTNVFGHGMQKGHVNYFRGAPIETRLLPKIKIDVVISEIPTETLIKTVEDILYTGNVGDGKIFVYDVEDVVKIRTGEHGHDALQDES